MHTKMNIVTQKVKSDYYMRDTVLSLWGHRREQNSPAHMELIF